MQRWLLGTAVALAVAAPAIAADMRDQLVETGIREGVVLHLAHGSQAGHAETDRGAEHPSLGKRRVDATIRPEAFVQPGGRAEDAAGATNVLADHEHGVVARELGVERVVHRFDQGELSHAATP